MLLITTQFHRLCIGISSVAHLCPTLCNLKDCNTPGLPVHHQLAELTQTPWWWCHPTISSSAVPFSSCPQSFPASGIFKWVRSLYQVAKVLEFQLQHQSFQWTPSTDQGCIIYGHNWISLSNHNCCHGCTLSSKIPQMSSMSTDRGMDKEEVIHMYNGILLSH